MLRVYRFEEPYSIRLRIEGVLTAEGISSLEEAWREVVSRAENRKLSLDASGITRADETGIAFLTRLRTLGANVDDDGRFVMQDKHTRGFTRLRQGLCLALCTMMPGLHRCPCDQRA